MCSSRDTQRSTIGGKQIEEAVSRALRGSGANGISSQSDSMSNTPVKNIQPYNEISFDDAMESPGEDGLSDVADVLDMFRRK